MAILQTSSLELAFCNRKQAAYGTATANTGTFIRSMHIGRAILESAPNFVEDGANQSSDAMAAQYIATHGLKGITLNYDFSFQHIGYFLQQILGAMSTSGSGVYTHTFGLMDLASSRQHPVRTWLQNKGSAIQVFRDIGVTNLTIEKNKVGRISMSIQLDGSGVMPSSSGYSMPAPPSGLVYSLNNQVNHDWVSLPNSLEDIEHRCQIESWRWSFGMTEQGDGYRDCGDLFTSGSPASGQVKKERLTSQYNIDCSFTYRADSADKAHEIMRAGQVIEIDTTLTSPEIVASSTAYSMVIADTAMQIREVSEQAEDHGAILYTVNAFSCADPTSLEHTTAVTLVNNVASYTS